MVSGICRTQAAHPNHERSIVVIVFFVFAQVIVIIVHVVLIIFVLIIIIVGVVGLFDLKLGDQIAYQLGGWRKKSVGLWR